MRKTRFFLLICSVAMTTLAGLATEEAWKGRQLSDAIDALRRSGLSIIYSTDLVRPEMRVVEEPSSPDPRTILDEILAPHELTTRSGPGDSILVVRRRQASEGASDLGAIVGTVHDRKSGAAVSDVAIVLDGSEAALTDSEGRFRIDAVSAGSHNVEAHLAGYIVWHRRVTVRSREPLRLDIRLVPAAIELEQIVVTSGHYSVLQDEPSSRFGLDRREVERIPNFSDDIYRTLMRLPGVSSGDVSARLNVRGGDSDEVLVVLDGLEIPQPFHLESFQSVFSIIDSRAVGGVDFMTGGFPVEYGGRLSGVIDVSTRTPSVNRSAVGIDFVNTRALSEGTFRDGRGSWLASARRGYLDLVLGWVDPDSGFEPTYWDALGRVQTQIGGHSTLALDVLSAHDKVHYDESDEGADGTYGNDMLWLDLHTAWTPRLDSQTVLSVGRTDRKRTGAIQDRYDVNDHRASDFAGLRQLWHWSASPRHYLSAGFEARSVSADYDVTTARPSDSTIFFVGLPGPLVPQRILTNPSGTSGAAWVADRVRLGGVTMEAGARWDRQSWIEGNDQWSPRINLIWQPRPKTALRAGWGRFHQAQRISELQVEDGVDRFHRAERADAWFVGVEHEIVTGLATRVELYDKSITSPAPRYENYFDTLEIFPEAVADRHLVAPSEARASGVELFVEHETGAKVSWWASYAWASAEDRLDGAWIPRKWDQRHTVSASINWHPGALWNFNLAGIWHSGWPISDISATWRMDDQGRIVIEPILGPLNAERLPGYLRFDVRASRVVDLRSSRLRFYLEIVNVTDRRNICCIDEFQAELLPGGMTRLTPDYDEWLPWIPSFGIQWEF